MKTEMNAQRDVSVIQRVRKNQIGRRIVCRITADDDQHVDFAAMHVGNQIAD